VYIGHYGVSYALKKVDREAPLSHLFIGVQLMDVAWSALVLLGIEKVKIVPGFMKGSALNLYFMPYTHSLEGALGLSLLAFIAYLLLRKGAPQARLKTALVMGFSVFSHWLLDLIVHGPDLGLLGDAHKVGFGLWNYPLATFAVEALLLVGGILIYQRVAKPTRGMWVYAAGMILINGMNILGQSTMQMPAKYFAVGALVSYFAFALIAGRLDRASLPRG
jgi:hypothetical protein